MDIAFRVRNVEVPDSLRRVTLDKVMRVAGWCGVERADVCFSEERNPRIAEREVCEITLFAKGRVLRAQAAATEVAVAADRVVGKLEQRAARFRGRSGRSGRARRSAGSSADSSAGRSADRSPDRRYSHWCPQVIRPTWGCDGSVNFRANRSTVDREPGAGDQVVGDAGEAADPGFSDSECELLTPEEAALEMGERGTDIFFFVNAETGRPAVVYRRADGHVALVDSATPTAAGMRS
jgi:ribosomal subunit interface protein